MADNKEESKKWIDALNYSKNLYAERARVSKILTKPAIEPIQQNSQTTPNSNSTNDNNYADYLSWMQTNIRGRSFSEQHSFYQPSAPPLENHPQIVLTQLQWKQFLFTEGKFFFSFFY